ncbi:MAG: cell division protein FtsA [bacterium]|nr:cell division protein FtsA [bacterium]
MSEHQNPHFVGLDIGNNTVKCVVGTLDPNDPSKPAIVSHSEVKNKGMRKGVIAHIDDVADSISQAVHEAERVSGFQIHSATVNINGSHVLGINSTGVIAISSTDRQIGNEDRLRSEEAATIVNLPLNREIIQVFAKNYRVDGQDNIKDPVGMHGVRLEVDTHIVTAATPNVKSMETTLEKSQVRASNRTVSSLAAAEAVMTREQKEAGTLLIDIGAGTTNLAVIEDGEVQFVGVLPIGGINITNDLAIGLKTDLDIADKVKIEHGTLAPKRVAGTVRTKNGKEFHNFKVEDINMIIEARMEELFELVDKELKKINKSQRLPGGVVLVGGTSKLPGIDEFAREKLQLAARLGHLQPIGGLLDTVKDSRFSAAVGLMLLDMYLEPQHEHHGMSKANEQVFGALGAIWDKLSGSKKH